MKGQEKQEKANPFLLSFQACQQIFQQPEGDLQSTRPGLSAPLHLFDGNPFSVPEPLVREPSELLGPEDAGSCGDFWPQ